MNAPTNFATARRIIDYPLDGPTLVSPTDSMSTALFKATCVADFLAVLADMEASGEIDFSGEQTRRMISGRALIAAALVETLSQLTAHSDQMETMAENMSDQHQEAAQ